ncbi:hypothetical protein K458DRAFT_418897 [Lentithecium fluviatile CBS 122367]|uniref:F-box domain-containing protein n=1 Tax=Lentithecium fluviatile CBS 122367 TaxID=1168545 RepID=A0A6G1IZ91_9PLEO|nr:hypothetical protein K458DRAFT_418897 [Lentithecium fluviatile CBS 122367]
MPNLLDLPIELRLEIYKHIWTPLPTSHPRLPPTSMRVLAHSKPTIAFALLLTCRKIHAEARTLAYTRHTFILEGGENLLYDPSRYFRRSSNHCPRELVTSLLMVMGFGYDGRDKEGRMEEVLEVLVGYHPRLRAVLLFHGKNWRIDAYERGVEGKGEAEAERVDGWTKVTAGWDLGK